MAYNLSLSRIGGAPLNPSPRGVIPARVRNHPYRTHSTATARVIDGGTVGLRWFRVSSPSIRASRPSPEGARGSRADWRWFSTACDPSDPFGTNCPTCPISTSERVRTQCVVESGRHERCLPETPRLPSALSAESAEQRMLVAVRQDAKPQVKNLPILSDK